MTKEERSEYMRNYRKEHKEQIKASTQRRNTAKALQELEYVETFKNGHRAHLKDGRTFDFVRPFDR